MSLKRFIVRQRETSIGFLTSFNYYGTTVEPCNGIERGQYRVKEIGSMLALVKIEDGEPTGWIIARGIKELRQKAETARVRVRIPDPEPGGKIQLDPIHWLIHFYNHAEPRRVPR